MKIAQAVGIGRGRGFQRDLLLFRELSSHKGRSTVGLIGFQRNGGDKK